MPVGPFVATLRAPIVQMMRDAAAREHGGHLVGRVGYFPWATAGRQVDVATPVLVEKPGVRISDKKAGALLTPAFR